MFNTYHLPLYGYVFGAIKMPLLHACIGLPNEAWWLPMLVLLVLAGAAIIDAFSSVVPDSLVFLGLLAVVATHGLYISWPFALWHLTTALGAGVIVWLANMVWRYFFKVDALGLGDAKWSALAVACFDVTPVTFAWGFGAWLALIWLGALRLAHYQTTRVYFTPFLFIGLVVGLYVLRLRVFF